MTGRPRTLVAFVLLTAVLTWLGGRGLKVQDDPLASLGESPLFSFFYDRSPFKGKIYVDGGTPALDAELQGLGYRPFSAAAAAEGEVRTNPGLLLSLVPLLPADVLARARSPEHREAIRQQAQAALSLPGGTAYLQELAVDPLMLRPLVAEALLPRGQGTQVATYTSPTPQSFPTIGKAYDRLVAAGPGVHFIGGDFFAYENYLAVKGDITFCLLVSIPLNLLLFFLFVRRWLFLVFLALGSFLSYATGLVAVRLFYDEVFALVFAFTSTFIGFNNEYLVHLSGLDRTHLKRTIVSLGSAIGTTLIGFLVLLGSSSAIIRQMALVSIGAMAGFLAFLLANQRVLATIRIRHFRWPQRQFGTRALVAGWGGLHRRRCGGGHAGGAHEHRDVQIHDAASRRRGAVLPAAPAAGRPHGLPRATGRRRRHPRGMAHAAGRRRDVPSPRALSRRPAAGFHHGNRDDAGAVARRRYPPAGGARRQCRRYPRAPSSKR